MERGTPKPVSAFLLAVLFVGGCGGCDRTTPTPAAERNRAEAGSEADKRFTEPIPERVQTMAAGVLEEDCFVLMDAKPDYGEPPLKVAFTAEVECTEGAKITYAWNFGDGSPSSSESSPVHTYAAAGDYIVTLKVTDSTGAFGTDEMDVFVEEETGSQD